MSRSLIESLGWTLVHFLWQGALLAAALSVMDMALAKARAAARYTAACAALALMLIVPAGTFLALRSQARPAAVTGPPIVARSVAPRALAMPLASSSAVSHVARGDRKLERPSFSLARLLPWVVQAWILGVVLLSLRLLGGWWLVRRLVRSSGNVSLEAWQTRLRDLARRMGVSRAVRLCRSTLVEVPTVVGWLRPMILLPASTLTGLAPAQIEAILAHELAHIRRHDYAVNLLQSLVEMLLFYHPAVWWVSKRIRDERELCCDDLAIAVSGDAVAYARALYELERLRGAELELALAASGGSLAKRIARLLGLPGRPWESATRGLVGLAGASAVICLLALGGMAPAAKSAVAPRAARAPQTCMRVAVRGPVTGIMAPVALARGVATKCAQSACDAAEAATASAASACVSAEEIAVTASAAAERIAVSASACAPQARAAVALASVGPTAAGPNPPMPLDTAAPRRFSSSEWERMRQHGITEHYVEAIEPNLPGLSADQLMRLADHGVGSIYVANLRNAGLEHPSVDDLVRLAEHGVSSEYVSNLRRAGLDRLSVDDLVRLADHGVSSEYVRGLKGMDPNDLSVDELIRLATHGVTSEWYSAMDWMGLSQFSVEQAIELRSAGITPEYANKLKLVTHRRLSLDELRRLATQGVTSDYAARMYVLLGRSLDVEQLVRLHNAGVGSEYAEQMMVAAGPLEAESLIQLRNHGVSAEYAYDMSMLGRLEAPDLIRLHDGGVSSDFVREARARGFSHSSVSDLIRMSQQGLPAHAED